jgi:uncharacterized protein YdhG (YjbR/CyaY superfamily)
LKAKRPTTIAEYIQAAPREAQPHLRKLYATLKDVAPSVAVLAQFRKELQKHQTTKSFLQIPYDKPLPVVLIRRIAKYALKSVAERGNDSFFSG